MVQQPFESDTSFNNCSLTRQYDQNFTFSYFCISIYGKSHSGNLIFMKHVIFLAITKFLLTPVFAQEVIHENPTKKMRPIDSKSICWPVESPAYLDSTLFTDYLNRNLQPDSLTMQGKPAKGDTIMILYIVSKEGRISSAKIPGKEKTEFMDFVLQKLLNCPYQWSPAFRNGRTVNYFGQIRVVF